jgi:hypothetical protein
MLTGRVILFISLVGIFLIVMFAILDLLHITLGLP